MRPGLLKHRATTVATAGLVLALAACGAQDEPGTVVAAEQSRTTDSAATTGGSATGDDPGTEAAASASGPDLEAARAGLARYLEANLPETPSTSTNIPGCPAIGQAVLEEALAGAGYPDTVLAGWATEIEWDEYEDVGDDVMGIVCGGDSDGDPNDSDFEVAAGVIVTDLRGTAGSPEMILGGGESEPGPEGLGGMVVTTCDSDDFCVAAWHRDDLVVGTVLSTEGANEEAARALLDATLPAILETLAGA